MERRGKERIRRKGRKGRGLLLRDGIGRGRGRRNEGRERTEGSEAGSFSQILAPGMLALDYCFVYVTITKIIVILICKVPVIFKDVCLRMVTRFCLANSNTAIYY